MSMQLSRPITAKKAKVAEQEILKGKKVFKVRKLIFEIEMFHMLLETSLKTACNC